MPDEMDIEERCRELAMAARLCTVTGIRAISEGIHRHATAPDTLEVERACGMKNAKYFFAEHLHPVFGSIALVYRREVEQGAEGSSNPFDTGGVFRGKTAPFMTMTPEERLPRARALISATTKDLTEWRDSFAEYLMDFFPEPEAYRAEFPIPMESSERHRYPEDLPVLHAENFGQDDFRFCAWEVRLEGAVPVLDMLEMWGCAESNHNQLHEWLIDDPDHPLAGLAKLEPVFIGEAEDVCPAMERSLSR